MNNDFIEYPKRIPPKDELCKCMHKKSSHASSFAKDISSCYICECPEYIRSSMNGNIEATIIEAKENAQPRLNTTNTNKYHNGIREPKK